MIRSVRHSSSPPSHLRNFLSPATALSPIPILLLLFLAAVPTQAHAQGYGYAKEVDPLLESVKGAIAAAREGNREKVTEALEALEPFLKEIETGLGVDLGTSIGAAKEKGDARGLAFELAELVYHQLRFKLEGNVAEKLNSPLRARRRLETAQHYYEQILSFAVRRADSKKGRTDHAKTLDAFDEIQKTVGSEGLFGVGAKDPDLPEFEKQSSALIARLQAVFPQFAAPRAGELGAPESREEPAKSGTAPKEKEHEKGSNP